MGQAALTNWIRRDRRGGLGESVRLAVEIAPRTPAESSPRRLRDSKPGFLHS